MNLPNAENLIESLKNKINAIIDSNTVLIGVQRGGELILQKILPDLKEPIAIGSINASFYRDDFSQIGVHPNVKPSRIPSQIEGRDIILVDDVFYTGRTVRAALNEIFDYGRPNQVVLAVLVERDGRQIPLSPDCFGARIELSSGQRIKLLGPDPLLIELQTLDSEF